ncbi:acyltransferase [Erythrobacter sp. KY5]|uniref:acyltransferase family protein n=1 Tax=Erythrobacter sp. KY5 TaxID=2011159 RepID=UPI000DBF23CE|nr:acyltransferase [Erythrobacter sp. KY5]AWW73389.1 acyltransferase [Erythrobacter sp. KY5]
MSVAGSPVADARPQLDQLTGLRGLAAWFVVLYHIRFSLTAILPGEVIAIFAKGYLAVDLFFMLSGFVMWLSYGEKFRSQGWAQSRPFLWKRFARVWPLHALILAGFVMLALVLAATGRTSDTYPIAELPLHILLIQNWGFTSELAWNPPAWSISAEFAAYLAFPALIIAIRWERLGLASLVAVIGALALCLHAWFAGLGYSILDDDIPRTGLVRCLAEFTIGIALAQLWRLMRESGRGGAIPFVVSASTGITGIALGLPETLWVLACFASLLLALALDGGPATRVLSSTPLVKLGDWSYATYLSHYLLFVVFKLAFVGSDLQIGWLGLAAYGAVVLAVSAALFAGFEKPAQKWLNQRTPLLLKSA